MISLSVLCGQAMYGKSEDDLEIEEQQELKRLMKGVCMSVCDPQEGEGDHLPPHGCSRQPA